MLKLTKAAYSPHFITMTRLPTKTFFLGSTRLHLYISSMDVFQGQKLTALLHVTVLTDAVPAKSVMCFDQIIVAQLISVPCMLFVQDALAKSMGHPLYALPGNKFAKLRP